MQERRAFLVVFAIAAALIIPAALTLRTVVHPVILQATSDNPTPLGYTWSLLLFIIPIGALGWWFARRPDLQFPRKAFWRTLAVLTPLGFALDLLFGNAFFVFPNKSATLGWEIPAVGGPIPIEEFVFYLAGFMLVLLSYIWCDEYWMAEYNVPRLRGDGRKHTANRSFSFCVCGARHFADRSCDCVSKVFVRRARRFPMVFHLSRLRVADSIGWVFSHCPAIH